MTAKEYLKLIDEVVKNGRYRDDWASLSGHPTPSWYSKAKFGIFIHWGIYSVPAFGSEWYSRAMYDPSSREFEYHRAVYGDQKTFGYKDFIPMFTGERFDPAGWVSLFKEAGAGFVMPVCEHHDGFAMYRTDFNRWNSVDMGPRRDVAGELKAECEKQGLTFCASTHRAEHYFFMNMGRSFDSDVNDPRYADFYGPAVLRPEFAGGRLHATTADTYSIGPDREWLEDWLVRTCELIDRYEPGVLYFDWWIHNKAFKPYLKKLCAYYYDRAEQWGREVTIDYKHEAFPPTVATFDVERGALTDISPVPWQTDTAVGKRSWGYVRDNEYKSARQIVCDLIDIVSKNGILLLNIGPKPDGTITDEETAVLRETGAWLRLNGEGVYGSTFWRRFGEGSVNAEEGFFKDGDEKAFTPDDLRFTYKNGYLYVFQMRPGKTAVVRSLRKRPEHDFLINSVTSIDGEPVAFTRDENALTITPAREPDGDMPVCYRVEIG